MIAAYFVCPSAVLLNSSAIYDKIFSDDFILEIIGALECKQLPLTSISVYISNDKVLLCHFNGKFYIVTYLYNCIRCLLLMGYSDLI